jgi:hypothetical protein
MLKFGEQVIRLQSYKSIDVKTSLFFQMRVLNYNRNGLNFQNNSTFLFHKTGNTTQKFCSQYSQPTDQS